MSTFIAAEDDSETIFEGKLDKEGRIAKATKPRWFVLTPTAITYYTDQTRKVRKESMYLTTDSVISPVEIQMSLSKAVTKYKFTVTGTDVNLIPLSMTLVSTNESDVNIWIERINDVKNLNNPKDLSVVKTSSETSVKHNTTVRIQKFLASKMSGSSVGQDVITSAVDETTRNIVTAFILAVKKYAGEKESLLVKENCFRILTKLAILYQNKVMQKEDFIIFSQFSDNLILTLSRSLMQIDTMEPVINGTAQLEKMITTLSMLFTQIQEAGMPILQKYMKESNSIRLGYVAEFFAQREFLQCILIGDSYGDIRATLRDMLYSSS